MDAPGPIAGILDVPDDERERLAAGLARGSIDPSSSVGRLRQAGLSTSAERAHAWLSGALAAFGTTPAIVAALGLIGDERRRVARSAPTAELILTGPDREGGGSRATGVVVRELFEAARHSVLIVGYAFRGSDHIFEPLARRMSRRSALAVRLVVNVHPIPRLPADETVRRFARDFLRESWPFEPRPEIYYDPRSLEQAGTRRGVVHAKMIVVDEEILYLGSANYTTAALERNIEAGIRLRGGTLGRMAARQFDGWIRRSHLVELPIGVSAP